MKNFIPAIAAATLVTFGAAADVMPSQAGDAIRFRTPAERSASTVFNTSRHRAVQSAVSRMESGKQSRFVKALEAPVGDGTYTPDYVFDVKDLFGDLDGPDGELWFYQGNLEYERIVHNEYWTEELPTAFEVSIYDADMKLVGTIKDHFDLKEDEVRVRQVDVLPIITQKYFNHDDNYEVAITIVVNPSTYGVRSYTIIYSLGNAKGEDGEDVPVQILNGQVADVLNASDEKGENVIMTFLTEYNDSGISEDDIYLGYDSSWNLIVDPDNFWNYNLGNKVSLVCRGAVDDNGEHPVLLSKTHIYYQSNGDQQYDALAVTMLHDGKPVVVYPHYENVFYNPFYSNMEDMSQCLPNNLIIDIYEQQNPGEEFVLKQSTKIPVVKPEGDDKLLYSYYAVGSFRYRDDIAFTDDIADFVITRRDYYAGDTETQSFLAYDSKGNLKTRLFENADSHIAMSDIDGFDPMHLFVSTEGSDYYFNFVNMRTFETELKLNYGLKLDDEDDDPDYMMANIERTLSPDGKSFMYVAEMRQPGYDDINDLSYLRVAWINRDGSFDHFDNINMGNNVAYATLFLDAPVLQPDFFVSDDKQEYMLLIKRYLPSGSDTTTEEQLLIAQVVDKDNPTGKDIMLLGDNEAGSLLYISPIYGQQNRLSVTYAPSGSSVGTTHYYNLPLDATVSGIEDVATSAESNITVNGNIVLADGIIELYNMQGVCVAKAADALDLTGLATGVYVARTASASAKVVVK